MRGLEDSVAAPVLFGRCATVTNGDEGGFIYCIYWRSFCLWSFICLFMWFYFIYGLLLLGIYLFVSLLDMTCYYSFMAFYY